MRPSSGRATPFPIQTEENSMPSTLKTYPDSLPTGAPWSVARSRRHASVALRHAPPADRWTPTGITR